MRIDDVLQGASAQFRYEAGDRVAEPSQALDSGRGGRVMEANTGWIVVQFDGEARPVRLPNPAPGLVLISRGCASAPALAYDVVPWNI